MVGKGGNYRLRFVEAGNGKRSRGRAVAPIHNTEHALQEECEGYPGLV